MRDALRGLHRIAPGIKYLGSYPRADRQPTVAPRIHSENSFDAAHAWVESLFPGGRPAHLNAKPPPRPYKKSLYAIKRWESRFIA